MLSQILGRETLSGQPLQGSTAGVTVQGNLGTSSCTVQGNLGTSSCTVQGNPGTSSCTVQGNLGTSSCTVQGNLGTSSCTVSGCGCQRCPCCGRSWWPDWRWYPPRIGCGIPSAYPSAYTVTA
jgi:hypothetical protein